MTKTTNQLASRPSFLVPVTRITKSGNRRCVGSNDWRLTLATLTLQQQQKRRASSWSNAKSEEELQFVAIVDVVIVACTYCGND